MPLLWSGLSASPTAVVGELGFGRRLGRRLEGPTLRWWLLLGVALAIFLPRRLGLPGRSLPVLLVVIPVHGRITDVTESGPDLT